MSFYSIYVFSGRVQLYAMKQEPLAIVHGGRLVSTQKGYQSAWEAANAMATAKQLPLVDCTEQSGSESRRQK